MNRNIGEYLASIGCREAIAFASIGRAELVRPWNVGAQIVSASPSPAEFATRYSFRNDGFHDGNDPAQDGVNQALFTAGSLCGHDIPSQHAAEIQRLAWQGGNPFQLEENSRYVVTEQDLLDLEYVKDPNQNLPVWLTAYPTLTGLTSSPLPANQGNPPAADLTRPAVPPPTGVKPGAVDAVTVANAHFAQVWKELRPAIRAAHGVVGVNVRNAIYDAFLPLLTAAGMVGLLGEDGSIQGGGDE